MMNNDFKRAFLVEALNVHFLIIFGNSRILDLSFNIIKKIENLGDFPELTRLYLLSNKIKKVILI